MLRLPAVQTMTKTLKSSYRQAMWQDVVISQAGS